MGWLAREPECPSRKCREVEVKLLFGNILFLYIPNVTRCVPRRSWIFRSQISRIIKQWSIACIRRKSPYID
jgi:hypothetical protein